MCIYKYPFVDIIYLCFKALLFSLDIVYMLDRDLSIYDKSVF